VCGDRSVLLCVVCFISGVVIQCFSLQPGHYSSLTAPNLQPTVNQGMYNLRFTTLMNTNNTSNYQPLMKHTTHNRILRSPSIKITAISINRNTLPARTKRQRTSHRTLTTKNHKFTLTLTPSIFTERNDQ